MVVGKGLNDVALLVFELKIEPTTHYTLELC